MEREEKIRNERGTQLKSKLIVHEGQCMPRASQRPEFIDFHGLVAFGSLRDIAFIAVAHSIVVGFIFVICCFEKPFSTLCIALSIVSHCHLILTRYFWTAIGSDVHLWNVVTCGNFHFFFSILVLYYSRGPT